MSVAVGEAQATITKKISLGNGSFLYIGTLAFGTEYATGGDSLGTAASERYSLPEKVEYLDVSGPYNFQLVPGTKLVKVYWPEKEKVKQLELAAKTDLSAQTALPFLCIGC